MDLFQLYYACNCYIQILSAGARKPNHLIGNLHNIVSTALRSDFDTLFDHLSANETL